MADYPPNEIVNMIRILGKVKNNYSVAERLYEKFPDRRHPDERIMKKVCDRAKQSIFRRIRQKSDSMKSHHWLW